MINGLTNGSNSTRKNLAGEPNIMKINIKL